MITSTEWLVTLADLGAVIVFDLILAIVRRNKDTSPREALGWTLFYVLAAVAFGYLLPHWAPAEYRKEFFAGWLTEYSLSVDNLFVFIILLASLKIKKESQQLVCLHHSNFGFQLGSHSPSTFPAEDLQKDLHILHSLKLALISHL